MCHLFLPVPEGGGGGGREVEHPCIPLRVSLGVAIFEMIPLVPDLKWLPGDITV